MAENNAAIGDLIVEYEQNERRVATLKAKLHRFGVNLETLGKSLKDYPADVQDSDPELRIRILGETRVVSHDSISFTEIRNHLRAWKDAVADKQRLEDCLKQAGLERFIQTKR